MGYGQCVRTAEPSHTPRRRAAGSRRARAPERGVRARRAPGADLAGCLTYQRCLYRVGHSWGRPGTRRSRCTCPAHTPCRRAAGSRRAPSHAISGPGLLAAAASSYSWRAAAHPPMQIVGCGARGRHNLRLGHVSRLTRCRLRLCRPRPRRPSKSRRWQQRRACAACASGREARPDSEAAVPPCLCR